MLFLNRLNVNTWSWIHQLYSIFWSFVNVLYKFIKIFKPHSGVGKCEIFSQSVHECVGSKMQSHGFKVSYQLVWFVNNIVLLHSWIVFNWLIVTLEIIAQAWRRAIMIIVYMCKNIICLILSVLKRVPYHF